MLVLKNACSRESRVCRLGCQQVGGAKESFRRQKIIKNIVTWVVYDLSVVNKSRDVDEKESPRSGSTVANINPSNSEQLTSYINAWTFGTFVWCSRYI
jgi:hypothetical protein